MRGYVSSRKLYARRVRREAVVDVRNSVKAGMNKMMGNRERYCQEKKNVQCLYCRGRKKRTCYDKRKNIVNEEEKFKCDKRPEDYC